MIASVAKLIKQRDLSILCRRPRRLCSRWRLSVCLFVCEQDYAKHSIDLHETLWDSGVLRRVEAIKLRDWSYSNQQFSTSISWQSLAAVVLVNVAAGFYCPL